MVKADKDGDIMIEKETSKIGWNFDNSYARLPKTFYTRLEPTPVQAPKLVIKNDSLAEALGLNPLALDTKEGISVLSGNDVPEGATPIAQAYAGHQFGHFTMLGDGRAILLGEQITPKGERFDIQLKGSGITPYSRGGDGRAALGPMLREYIISEGMAGLGIPTSRSLAVVTTGEVIFRENMLPSAILTRVASSHIRVGTFQYIARWGSIEEVRMLADYSIKRHYPEVEEDSNPYLSLLRNIIHRQAVLIAKWQLVGFIHGVMNTDNMAISGETIDYGPCAFMDQYDPATVFSSIDIYGRYAYNNQPRMAAWNLERLAEPLLPLIHADRDQAIEMAQDELESFFDIYHCHWLKGMRAKLGLFNEEEGDEALIVDLLDLMHRLGEDFTNTFRALTLDQGSSIYSKPEFSNWLKKWKARLERQEQSEEEARLLMKQNNPGIIPRNHRVEEALSAAVDRNDYSVMEALLNAITRPYAYLKEQEAYATLPEPSNRPYRTFCGT